MTVLTLHILTSVPWSNLNRDDTGTPKRTRQGGVQRALLSSQSLKRAARVAFENSSLEAGLAQPSLRSANLAVEVVERARKLNSELDEKKAKQAATKLIGLLTKKEKPSAEATADADAPLVEEAGRSAWLSDEELEAAAHRVATDSDEGEFVSPAKTGSLAIAAFGRMFANSAQHSTAAAVAVSPAVTTHQAEIEIDYFSTVDDRQIEKNAGGATYLGLAQYTSGIFYRSVTIDREELRRSWTGVTGEHARELLTLLVDALIRALPRGKKSSTAPYTLPLLVVAEEQRYRTAYDFETPVAQGSAGVHGDASDGGFATASLERLGAQRASALRFDPDNFPGDVRVGGVADPELIRTVLNAETESLSELVEHVVDWILA